jgi:ring-1,2-phenylacetyl-CoA epoxidase subunit PaaD
VSTEARTADPPPDGAPTAGVDPLTQLRDAVAAVPDPEIPVLTIADLGILRDVRWPAAGDPEVVITPTYSGCPATEAIKADVLSRARAVHPRARVLVELAPAWTTDWITEDGRHKLAEYGIAPPAKAGPPGARPGPVRLQLGRRTVGCPRCGSADTEVVSQFGSTPCKALRRCRSCAEPFDEFKPL